MPRIEKTVFISYRRTNVPWARAIYQDLTAHGYDAFFDFQSINSGDFSQVILENIKGRAHFVILLTPSALERCDDPNDWLRREIETAIETKRNIVPLMLESFDFGSPANAKYLTGQLALLKNYNGLRIYSEYFNEGMARLREKFLNVALEAVLHPVSAAVKQTTREQQKAASIQPAVKQKELTAQEWFEQGYKYDEAKNYDESIRCYTEAIRLKPDYAYAYSNRGLARSDKGDLDGALKDYTEAIRLKPDYADVYYNRGIERKNKGDLDGALKDYTEAIRLKPDFASAYNNRGIARKKKGDLDGALKDYTEAIRIKPDHANAHYNRGIVRKNKGDLNGALKDYTEAILLKPDYAKAYHNRGTERKNKGDLDGALKDYTEAIRLEPNYADNYWRRGNIWALKEDFYSAAADYQKYFDLGGKDEKVRQFLSDAKKEIGK